jgi:type II secretory ATPase GspE/PulE/Tfp pilus assembly ATPase PilB-like protein
VQAGGEGGDVGAGGAGGVGVAGGDPGAEAGEVNELRRASEAPPIVALVELILQRAVAVQASDIHIEPAPGRLRVRARVDGVLREILELPEQTSAGIASRLKILAGMDIAVKRRPQDGRSAVRVGGRELALRISTLPAQGGEKVVLRVLDPENAGRRLKELGMDAVTFERFCALLGRGHGVIMATRPTESAKTTTLYGALAALDRERHNILTLEDPVEYRLPGVTQVQVHRRAGLSFAAALRATLRQDPDVIMVGELRDRETVETALAAALTGHLVLSTLHTNDAPGAVTRLAEMGAPHYLIASGLIGVLAQRLVRRVCTHCRDARAPGEGELDGVPPALRPEVLHDARGCARCEGTGYRGRVGIYELLTVDGRIRELIMRRASTDAIRDAARATGMRSLGEIAWDQVRAGATTVAEVRPFVALSAEEAPVCKACGAGLRSDYAACPACGRTLRERCGCGKWFEEAWRWCAGCGSSRAR